MWDRRCLPLPSALDVGRQEPVVPGGFLKLIAQSGVDGIGCLRLESECKCQIVFNHRSWIAHGDDASAGGINFRLPEKRNPAWLTQAGLQSP